jgi:hypothetical protein
MEGEEEARLGIPAFFPDVVVSLYPRIPTFFPTAPLGRRSRESVKLLVGVVLSLPRYFLRNHKSTVEGKKTMCKLMGWKKRNLPRPL